MTCGCGCIPTPQSILDDDGVDVFMRMIPNTEMYASQKRAVLWARFRYYGIGSLLKTSDDAEIYDYWLQCIKDRYYIIKDEYDLKLDAWAEWLEKLDTDGINFKGGVTGSDSESTHEDLPDTQDAASSSWLSTRDKNRVDYSTETGMQSARVRDWMDGVPNVLEDFAREFDDYFYWGI